MSANSVLAQTPDIKEFVVELLFRIKQAEKNEISPAFALEEVEASLEIWSSPEQAAMARDLLKIYPLLQTDKFKVLKNEILSPATLDYLLFASGNENHEARFFNAYREFLVILVPYLFESWIDEFEEITLKKEKQYKEESSHPHSDPIEKRINFMLHDFATDCDLLESCRAVRGILTKSPRVFGYFFLADLIWTADLKAHQGQYYDERPSLPTPHIQVKTVELPEKLEPLREFSESTAYGSLVASLMSVASMYFTHDPSSLPATALIFYFFGVSNGFVALSIGAAQRFLTKGTSKIDLSEEEFDYDSLLKVEGLFKTRHDSGENFSVEELEEVKKKIKLNMISEEDSARDWRLIHNPSFPFHRHAFIVLDLLDLLIHETSVKDLVQNQSFKAIEDLPVQLAALGSEDILLKDFFSNSRVSLDIFFKLQSGKAFTNQLLFRTLVSSRIRLFFENQTSADQFLTLHGKKTLEEFITKKNHKHLSTRSFSTLWKDFTENLPERFNILRKTLDLLPIKDKVDLNRISCSEEFSSS